MNENGILNRYKFHILLFSFDQIRERSQFTMAQHPCAPFFEVQISSLFTSNNFQVGHSLMSPFLKLKYVSAAASYLAGYNLLCSHGVCIMLSILGRSGTDFFTPKRHKGICSCKTTSIHLGL